MTQQIMRRMRWGVALLALAMLVGMTSAAAAQVRFKDADGELHFVTSLNEVPAQYRSSAIGTAVAPRPPGQAPAIDWEKKAREIDAEQARRQALEDAAVRQAHEERARFLLYCSERYRMLAEKMAREGRGQVSAEYLVAFVGPKCAMEWEAPR